MPVDLTVGMKVQWDSRHDDMDLIVCAITGARAIVEALGTGQRFDVSIDRLIWPGRDGGESWEESRLRLLNAAVTLEEGIHPESPHATLAPWVDRLSSGWRRIAIIVDIATAVVVVSYYLRYRGSPVSLVFLVAFIILLLALISLAHSEFERQTLWIVKRIDNVMYHTFPYLSVIWLLLLVALLLLQKQPEGRLQITISAIGTLLVVGSVNDLIYGRSYRRRYFRLAFAKHTQRAIVSLAIFAASWSFLLAATRAGSVSAAGPLALGGAVIAAATAAIGAAIRLMVRQRKFATQLVVAIDELALSVRLKGESEKVMRAWLALDRNLLGGVDTGVPMFATRAESEHVRALLAVCIGRITSQPTWDKSWKLLEQAEAIAADWNFEQCRSGILTYLAESRKQFRQTVDTAA